MSILSRLFSRPVVEEKRSRGFALHYSETQKVTWTKREYESFSKEAYKQNVVAFQAVNKIASAVSAIEWEVWDGSAVLPDTHPLYAFLRKPNPAQSGRDWWRTRVCYLLLSGNNYDEVITDNGGRLLEMWALRPDRMSIEKSQTGLPGGFIYTLGQQKVRYTADPLTGESEILHTKLFNPLDDWYGLSPVEAAAYAVDQHNQTMTWVQSLLQNSAKPSGALVTKTEMPLSDAEFNRLKAEIESKYSGPENAGRPMLLEGGMDWKQMGLSPVDMEILRVKDSSARDISLAFGVPPLLLNIPGDNTYANYREARLGFYEDTVLPFLGFLADRMNSLISPIYSVEIRPNRDKIEAIADKRQKLWEMADASEDLTLNECRELKGYPPLPDPLGSMLMSEVRARAKPQPPKPEDVPAETLKRLAYGTR